MIEFDSLGEAVSAVIITIIIVGLAMIGIMSCEKCEKRMAINNGTYNVQEILLDSIHVETRYDKYVKIVTDKDCYITEDMTIGNQLLVNGRTCKGKQIKITYYIKSNNKYILSYSID